MTHSPHIDALNGILIAARNYSDDSSLCDAVRIHTSDLSTDDVTAVILMLAEILATGFADLVRDAEAAVGNITAKHAAQEPDGNPPP